MYLNRRDGSEADKNQMFLTGCLRLLLHIHIVYSVENQPRTVYPPRYVFSLFLQAVPLIQDYLIIQVRKINNTQLQ